MNCPDCGKVVDAHVLTCTMCGCFVGFPNVRAAEAPDEIAALDQRYLGARQAATAAGRLAEVEAFEARLKTSFAVLNTRIADLHAFLANPKALYTTYSLGVKGQVRKPADPANDQERRGVEAKLFGTFGEEIRYAALSLDGAGVISYGAVTIRLREIAVAKRSSLLEENSFDFVDRHQLLPSVPVPRGSRSSWKDRHRLGVAKLGGMVHSGDGDEQFADLVLHSDGDRSTDRFIEVHIYGAFDADAIEAVRGKVAGKSKAERAEVERVKDLLRKRGCTWVDDA